MRGRKTTNLRNSWHPAWYRFLAICADQVLRAYGYPCSMEKEDLISIGWMKVMRYRDPVPESVVWSYVKREMWRAIEEQFDHIEDMDKIEWCQDYDTPETEAIAVDLVMSMPKRERFITTGLLEGRSLKEVGRQMHLSGERIRQIRNGIRSAPAWPG